MATFGLLESEISLYAGKDLCDENAELQDCEAFGMRTDVLDIHINSLDLSPFLDEKRRKELSSSMATAWVLNAVCLYLNS